MEEEKIEAILTIKDVSERSRRGPQRIHRDIDKGLLKAYKVGWQWLINESDYINYMERTGPGSEAQTPKDRMKDRSS